MSGGRRQTTRGGTSRTASTAFAAVAAFALTTVAVAVLTSPPATPSASAADLDAEAARRIAFARSELFRQDAAGPVRTGWATMLFLERDPSAREVLLEAIRPGSPAAVRAAVCAAIAGEQLAARPPPEFDAPVLQCLSEPEPVLRDEAAAAAGRLAQRPGSRLPAKLSALADDAAAPPAGRLAAVRAIGFIHTRAAFADLAARLERPVDAATEAAAIDGLRRITGRADLTAARQWRDEARELTRLSDDEFEDLARRLRGKRLRQLDEARRSLEEDLTAAESALFESRPAEQRAAFLADRLRHRQPCVRVWAAGRLTSLPDREVTAAMLSALLDGLAQPESPAVRSACAAALPWVEERLPARRVSGGTGAGGPVGGPVGGSGGKPAEPAGPPRLRDQLERETDPEVAGALLAALAAYRDPDDIPRIGRRLYDSRDRVIEAAAAALASLSSAPRPPGAVGAEPAKAAEPYVARLLDLTHRPPAPSDPRLGPPPSPVRPGDESLRLAALRAAVSLAPEAALSKRLGELLEDPSPEMREQALLGLEARPGAVAAVGPDPVFRRLADGNRRVRSAAIQVAATVAAERWAGRTATALDGRLDAEADPEIRQRLVVASAAVAGRETPERQLALADRLSRAEPVRRRVAAEIRRRLLEPGSGLKEEARPACLAAAAESLRELGEFAEAAARFRQLCSLLRMRDPEAALRAGTAAFGCLTAAKRGRDAWDWAAELAGLLPAALRTRLPKDLPAELAAQCEAGREDAVLDALAVLTAGGGAAAATAEWTRDEGFKSAVFRLGADAETRRRERLRTEAARSVGAWVAARGDAERKDALTALQLLGPAALAEAVRRLRDELDVPPPPAGGGADAAVEGALVRLCGELLSARPAADRPFDPSK